MNEWRSLVYNIQYTEACMMLMVFSAFALSHYIAPFPPQDLSPKTRDIGVVLGVFRLQEPGSKTYTG